jgi:hypothetical protein
MLWSQFFLYQKKLLFGSTVDTVTMTVEEIQYTILLHILELFRTTVLHQSLTLSFDPSTRSLWVKSITK